jgi:methionine sulfoxide reductase heme-binding subunit
MPSPGTWYRLAKPLVFLIALAPAALLTWRVLSGDIRGDWIDTIERETGRWALRFLAISLAVTPLRRLTGWGWLVKYRRMLGLFAFFYATVHVGIYAGLDLELQLGEVAREITKRKYLVVGALTYLTLVPLALTSTKGWIRRLGGRRWNRLHRLVYAAAVGGTVHYLWAVKKDALWPLVYFAVFALLLGYRVWARRREGVKPGGVRPGRVAPGASPV